MRSLLFVRSVPVAEAVACLRWLRQQAPGTRVAVLTSAAGCAPLEAAGVSDACEIYEPARMGIAAAGPLRLLRLARRRFDVVVVPHVGNRRDYRNVARFALALRGRVTLWLQCDAVPSGGDPRLVLDPVVLDDVWPEARNRGRYRAALLAAVKWPALVAVYAAAMVILAVAAAILLPLVWLKPDPGGKG
jgi:hypothetical protein